ncbi:hypothetical protein FIC_00238 [Flavobacteriaceae bacterium 3519-10]|nr:hypothetical protein FIC_00238 [Flavobacteriaceae bacterium 3519-10]
MKKLFLISGLILFLSCHKDPGPAESRNVSADSQLISGQSHNTVANLELKSVEDIKTEYNLVNRLLQEKKLDSASFLYSCAGERQGNVVYYYENRQLRSIRHTYSEYSHFSAVENYFIKDGNVFFIFKKETGWTFDGGTPEKPETRDNSKEFRYYMVNGKPLQCFEKEYTVRSAASANPQPENIKNTEVKNCETDKVLKRYRSLVENQKTKKCVM